MPKYRSHYDYLEQHMPQFLVDVGLTRDHFCGLLSAHGDKAYGYRRTWQEAGVHFYHGVAIYLLSYFRPFSQEVRETANGWVPTDKWVIDNIVRFLPYLPPVEDSEE